MLLSLEPSLPEDTPERAGCQRITGLPGQGDSTWLPWVLELAMAAPRRDYLPTLSLEQAEQVAYLH